MVRRFKSDDVVIVSFPKSGTTWLQYLLYLIANWPAPEFNKLSDVVLSLGVDNVHKPRTDKRLFKTHARLSQVPREPLRIYIMRDPRDVCVSAFHQFGSKRLGMDLFVDRFIKGDIPFGSWLEHTQDAARTGGCLFISYEHALFDTVKLIEEIAEYIGAKLPPGATEQIADDACFESMAEKSKKLSPVSDDKAFFRRGVVGSWRDELTTDQAIKIASLCYPEEPLPLL